MKTNLKNTARLAVNAGLCASLLMGSMPVQAFADEPAGVEPANQMIDTIESGQNLVDPQGDQLVDELIVTEDVSAPVPAADANSVDGWVEDQAAKTISISTVDALKHLAKQVNGGTSYAGYAVTLEKDLDLANVEWTPIGYGSKPFSGIFDGDNHTISNLKVTGNTQSTSEADKGLFGYTAGGEVKNLAIHNANISGGLNVGAFVGTPYTSKMTNLKLTGDVKVRGMSYVGGMFGKNAYNNLTNLEIKVNPGSLVSADSGSYRAYVGGVVGFMGEGDVTVQNVRSNVSVSGTTCDVGGITGIAHYGNKFKNCVVESGVSVSLVRADKENLQEIGGIAGVWMNTKTADIEFVDCAFNGSLSAADSSGNEYTSNVQGNAMFGCPYYAPAAASGGTLTIIQDGKVTIVPGSVSGMKKALQDLKDGQTVRLSGDVACNVVIPEGITATIDLAGHKLSNDGDHTIVNKGNLTIVDSAGTGVIDCVTNGEGALVNEGTCTIKGGKLTRSAEKGMPGGKGANTWYVVSNKGALDVVGGEVVNTSEGSSLVSNAGTMNVSGGHFSNGFIAIKSEENSALNITGGTVDSKDQAVQNWGNAVISGGTFNGRVVAWAYDGHSSSTVIDGDVVIYGEVGAVNYDGGAAIPSVTIKDGTVTGEIFKGTFENGKLEKVEPTDDGAKIEISGGAFGDKSAGDFIAPDAGLGLDQDGNFVPVEPAFTLADTVVDGTLTFDVLGGTAREFSEADLLAFVGVNVVDYTLSVDTSNLAALNKAIKKADTSKSFDFKYTATKKASKTKAADANSITTVVTVKLVDTGDPTVQPVEKVTVTFKDGFGGEFAQKVEAGSKLVRPEDPKHDGYKFAGWFETVSGNVVSDEWDFDKDVVEGDMTLYAGWFKDGAPADQKPELEPGSMLPQTGDVSTVVVAIPSIAGVAAIAAGIGSSKRRRAE